ncbi:hypothetical protein Nepgr_017538 [Nepenthes gracilis]|uniref:Uncharacterized protein n=1 Tax=Nepenthes gracilis TaxID=150966 RepID=A0AAD3SRA2_NEPGR|nr:hypothetical protein Nepgr_017538 [Nepenthes gracilis]
MRSKEIRCSVQFGGWWSVVSYLPCRHFGSLCSVSLACTVTLPSHLRRLFHCCRFYRVNGLFFEVDITVLLTNHMQRTTFEDLFIQKKDVAISSAATTANMAGCRSHALD